MRGSSTALALCLALFAAPALADGDKSDETPPEVTFELAGNAVIVHTADVEQTVRVGCTSASFAALENMAYVLCAPNVVVVIEATPKPRVIRRTALSMHVVSLSVKDGVVLARTDAGLKPLRDIPPSAAPALVVVSEGSRSYDVHPRRKEPPKPPISGLEVGLLGTAGAGVDTHPGAFGYFDASLIGRFPFGLSLAAYGNFGAGTGPFDPGTRNTGPFGGDVQLASFEAHVGLDMRWFAISIGFGAGLREEGYDVEPLFAVRGRGGEVDGFTFTWHSSFAIHGPNAFGVLGGMLEFPVTKTWWLGADAELGNLRYGRFMVDVRHRVAGTTDHGTFDVRASLGLSYLQTSASDPSSTEPCGFNSFSTGTQTDTECLGTNTSYLGPAVSLGFIWRP